MYTFKTACDLKPYYARKFVSIVKMFLHHLQSCCFFCLFWKHKYTPRRSQCFKWINQKSYTVWYRSVTQTGRWLYRELYHSFLPDTCQCGRGQPSLQKDVSDLRSRHEPVHVTVCLVEVLIVFGFVCWWHHPLQSPHDRLNYHFLYFITTGRI